MNFIEIQGTLVNLDTVKYIKPTVGIEINFIDGRCLSFNDTSYYDFKKLLLKNNVKIKEDNNGI